MSSDDSTRVTIRLPQDTLARLREELDSFNTETARFQYLVQLYFDWKEVGRGIPAYEAREDG